MFAVDPSFRSEPSVAISPYPAFPYPAALQPSRFVFHPVAETNSVAVIVIITYVVGLGNFAHVVAGGIDVMYGAMTGAIGWGSSVAGYILPALLGNILGGVSLVAALNHAQVVAGKGGGESTGLSAAK